MSEYSNEENDKIRRLLEEFSRNDDISDDNIKNSSYDYNNYSANDHDWKTILTSIKTKLLKSKELLLNALSEFKNGGYVLDDVPLAAKEFKDCIEYIDSLIKCIDEILKIEHIQNS